MKAIEFRQGNLVYVKECDNSISIDKVVSIQHFDKIKTMRGWFAHSNIPITEEWLLKFGFEKEPKIELENYYFKDGWLCENYSEGDGGIHFIAKCEYVHQLQNLYFALTGKELQLKEQL